MYGFSKSSISGVIKRKTEHIGAFDYDATQDGKRQERRGYVERIVLRVVTAIQETSIRRNLDL